MCPSDLDAFLACNETELYQLLRKAGVSVHPCSSREVLAATLLEEMTLPPWQEINSWRHGLMTFILDNWESVKPQLTCPAKSGDPLSCFGCHDLQVIACLVDNAEHLSLIQLRKKKT